MQRLLDHQKIRSDNEKMDRSSNSSSPYRSKVGLYADDHLWCSLLFDSLSSYLTADEFNRQYDSIISFDWRQLLARTK